MKLSIVIPVYNVEKYIARCLDSLKALNVENEIIVVNDGSADLSLKYAEEFKAGNPDENIIIVSQENRGLSEARNTGIRAANGDYVSFIDSDDFVDTDKYRDFVKKVMAEDLDAGLGNGLYCYPENPEKNLEFRRKRQVREYSRTDTGKNMCLFLHKYNNFRVEVWNNLYKRTFLLDNGIWFKSGIFHEDELFIIEVFLKAERVRYFDISFYNYVQRDESIMASSSSKRYYDIITVADEMRKLLENVKENKVRRLINRKIYYLYKDVLFHSEDYFPEDHKFFLENYLQNYSDYFINTDISIKYKIENRILKFNYRLFIFLIKIKKFFRGAGKNIKKKIKNKK